MAPKMLHWPASATCQWIASYLAKTETLCGEGIGEVGVRSRQPGHPFDNLPVNKQ